LTALLGHKPYSTIAPNKFAYKAKPGSTPGRSGGDPLSKTAKYSNRRFVQKSTAVAPTGRRTKKPVPGKREPWMLDPRSRVFDDGRQELRGIDKENRREEIFERAGNRCEDTVLLPVVDGMFVRPEVRCYMPATEWSHMPCKHSKVGNGHGRGFKCDAMSCGIASCKKCHERLHAGRKAA
jgi:hypothetical protein